MVETRHIKSVAAQEAQAAACQCQVQSHFLFLRVLGVAKVTTVDGSEIPNNHLGCKKPRK